MNKPQQLRQRLDDIGASLAATNKALALIGHQTSNASSLRCAAKPEAAGRTKLMSMTPGASDNHSESLQAAGALLSRHGAQEARVNSFRSRLYATDADLIQMIDLLREVRPPDRVSDYPGAADLREMLCQLERQANTRLWFDQQNQLIAFGLVDDYHNLLFDYRPRANSGELEEAIVQWGAACRQRMPRAPDEYVTLDAVCREEDAERAGWLTRHGFQPQALRTLRFIRTLSEPIPDPQLPTGFVIRSVTGENEVEALVALHRAAFGTKRMTFEERRAMMNAPGYDPKLDLVAIAPDGCLAGFCICGIPAEENAVTGRTEGYTDPVGVHPAFQRKGLARALLLTGLQLLRECDVEVAALGTSSENTAMQAAARSAGFQVESSKVWFSKPV
jgi:mycothiol synthase